MQHFIDMKKMLLLIAVFVASPCALLARGEASDTTKVKNETKEAAIAPVLDAAYLKKQVDSLNAKVELLQKLSDGYEAQLALEKQKHESDVNAKDKIISENSQTIKAKDNVIQQLTNNLRTSDTNVARLLNNSLYYPYSKEAVERAVSKFDEIKTAELRSSYGQLKILLNNYGTYTDELRNLFIMAESDKDFENPFKKTSQTYIDKIRSTRYYLECYNKDWTIPYLNKIVDNAIKILKSYDPKKKELLRLQYLLDN